jgi:hypothetical protein
VYPPVHRSSATTIMRRPEGSTPAPCRDAEDSGTFFGAARSRDVNFSISFGSWHQLHQPHEQVQPLQSTRRDGGHPESYGAGARAANSAPGPYSTDSRAPENASIVVRCPSLKSRPPPVKREHATRPVRGVGLQRIAGGGGPVRSWLGPNFGGGCKGSEKKEAIVSTACRVKSGEVR